MTKINRILLVGTFNDINLESSYLRSAIELNMEVETFDYNVVLNKYILFGKIGKTISTYIDIQAWLSKMNREFVIKAKAYTPDIIIFFCNVKVSPAAVLFLKSVLKNTQFVLVWPDSLNNVQNNIFQMAGLMDLMASYSGNSIPYFQQAGFRNVHWVPLAGDIQLNYKEIDESQAFKYDISFIGNWRLEREEMLVKVLSTFKGKRIGVFGPSWNKYVKNAELKRICQNRIVSGLEMSTIFQQSKVNLNKIDDTNYPAANMRFFEIPIAGGLMLSSECPEMENVYKENESVLYFKNNMDLIEKIDLALGLDSLEMRRSAQNITRQSHSYTKRLESIISLLYGSIK